MSSFSFIKVSSVALLAGMLLSAAPAWAADLPNLNNATESELLSVQDVPQEVLKNILEMRSMNGDFQSMDELKDVQGVTPDVLNVLKKHFRIDAVEGVDCNC